MKIRNIKRTVFQLNDMSSAGESKYEFRFARRSCKANVSSLFTLVQGFILRARVLKLYRQALRTAQRAPDHARVELKQTIRQEMENNRNCKDKQRIRFLVSDGTERLKRLDEMLDMQGS